MPIHRIADRLFQRAALVTLAGILSCTGGGQDARTEALNSLVESERAFARSATELGVQEAFLAFLADDAVLFRPRVVKGKEWLAKQPPTPGQLSWEPRYADVAESADLGFTLGPWTYRPEGADSVVARGYYFSVWRRGPDGVWKVVIDHGTTSAPPAAEGDVESASVTESRGAAKGSIDRGAVRTELLRADRSFAGAVGKAGSADRLDRFVSAQTRVVRDGRPPTLVASLNSLESAWPTPMFWEVLGGDVSNSGTFGFTFGEYETRDSTGDRPIEDGNYLRTWRRDGDGNWRIVVDLMSAVTRYDTN